MTPSQPQSQSQTAKFIVSTPKNSHLEQRQSYGKIHLPKEEFSTTRSGRFCVVKTWKHILYAICPRAYHQALRERSLASCPVAPPPPPHQDRRRQLQARRHPRHSQFSSHRQNPAILLMQRHLLYPRYHPQNTASGDA